MAESASHRPGAPAVPDGPGALDAPGAPGAGDGGRSRRREHPRARRVRGGRHLPGRRPQRRRLAVAAGPPGRHRRRVARRRRAQPAVGRAHPGLRGRHDPRVRRDAGGAGSGDLRSAADIRPFGSVGTRGTGTHPAHRDGAGRRGHVPVRLRPNRRRVPDDRLARRRSARDPLAATVPAQPGARHRRPRTAHSAAGGGPVPRPRLHPHPPEGARPHPVRARAVPAEHEAQAAPLPGDGVHGRPHDHAGADHLRGLLARAVHRRAAHRPVHRLRGGREPRDGRAAAVAHRARLRVRAAARHGVRRRAGRPRAPAGGVRDGARHLQPGRRGGAAHGHRRGAGRRCRLPRSRVVPQPRRRPAVARHRSRGACSGRWSGCWRSDAASGLPCPAAGTAHRTGYRPARPALAVPAAPQITPRCCRPSRAKRTAKTPRARPSARTR